ncbi:MAG: hypothetical protein AAGA69_02330 [Pseudomonadota bacterium]
MADAHPEAIPAFGSGMYDPYKKRAPDTRRGLFGRLFSTNSKPAPPVDAAGSLTRSMAEGLAQGIEQAGAGADDVLLFHTADGATYRAVAALFERFSPEQLPQMHICTPYDPVGVMPNRKSPKEVADAIHALEEKSLLGRRIHLYGENSDLALHLAELWEVPVSPLPLPVNEQEDEPEEECIRFRREILGVSEDSFVIASLGAARLEKGFNLFPDIIRRCFEFAGSAEYPGTDSTKIHFALHASPQIIGRHPVITATLEKLEAYGPDRVTLLENPLSDKEYQTLLHAADAICLPYKVEDYRVRGSGVVTEAVAARKFLVATQGSYPGRVAEAFLGGTGTTPMEMAKSLLSVIAERDARRPQLDQAVAAYRAEHNAEAYVTRMVGVGG